MPVILSPIPDSVGIVAKWPLHDTFQMGGASLPHQLACSYNEIAILCVSSSHGNEKFP